MKKLTMALLFMSLLSTQAFAAGENIGNNEVELAVNAILKANDGLSLEEKIYKLWQEAEGQIPTGFPYIDKDKKVVCHYGLLVNAKAEPQNALACLAKRSSVKIESLEVSPEFTVGFFRNLGGAYSGPVMEYDNLTNFIGSNLSVHKEFLATENGSSLLIKESSPFSIDLKNAKEKIQVSVRALSQNILVAVIAPEKAGDTSACASLKTLPGICGVALLNQKKSAVVFSY